MTSLKPEIACLCGLDEAGLGPVLGPLVVAGVMLAGPRGKDPWTLLRGVVSRGRAEGGRFQVADSKKVKQGPRGFERLERTALGFWTAWRGARPATLRALLVEAGCDLAALLRCPWYADLDLPLPVEADPTDLDLWSHLLQRALARADVDLLHAAVRPVEVEEFNARIAATDNKSDTHFEVYGEVLGELLHRAPAGTHVVADRCGGRMRYRQKLCALLPDSRIHKLEEGAFVSSYRVLRGDDRLRVTFAAEGEERAFPTALASCFAKYLRELMLRVLNAWFRERVPGLAPTAGYYVDGRRFLADVAEYVAASGLPRERLVRVR